MSLYVDVYVSSINYRILYMVKLFFILVLLYFFYSFVNKKYIYGLFVIDGFGLLLSFYLNLRLFVVFKFF